MTARERYEAMLLTGMTQAEIASHQGVTPQAVSAALRYESTGRSVGRPCRNHCALCGRLHGVHADCVAKARIEEHW